MRGHLTNIKVLAGQGEYASLEDYIAKLDESMSGFELTLQTGNPVTDVIVNDTRRRSLELGIRWQIRLWLILTTFLRGTAILYLGEKTPR